MTASQAGTLRFFVARHAGAFALILALSLAVTALDALTVAVLLPFLQALLGLPAAEGPAGRLGRLLALVPLADPVAAGAVLLLLLTPLKNALALLHDFMAGRAGGHALYEARKELVGRLHRAPYDYLLGQKQGRLMHLCLNCTSGLNVVMGKLPQAAIELMRAAAILVLLAAIHLPATLLLAVIAGLAQLAAGRLSSAVFYVYGRRRTEAGASQKVVFQELFTGLRQIEVYGVAPRWLGLFDESNRLLSSLAGREAAWAAAPKAVLETFGYLALFGSLLLVRWGAPGTFARALPLIGTFATAALKILPALSQLSRLRLEMTTCLPDLEAVREGLTMEIPPRPKGRRPFAGLREAVVFEGVGFAYPGRPPVLQGLDLEIPVRRSTAIVGGSGAGKTTLLNLLLGLVEPSRGRILVDGVDLRELDRASWMTRIGLVSQDAFIFNASVEDNIVFGRSGFGRDEAAAAARVAQADAFISELPEGYATQTGERGLKLSGGQQQRIAIARAVLGRPEILVFDEATSALDSVSEAAVRRALAGASQGRTVVSVSHRLASIMHADRIAVLEGGRIAEEGNHREMIARGGAYARLFESQQGPPGPGAPGVCGPPEGSRAPDLI